MRHLRHIFTATVVAASLLSVSGIAVTEMVAAASSDQAVATPSGFADAASPATRGYNPLVPARLLDTRTTAAPVGEGGSIDLVVTGVGGVPAAAVDSVVLNVTATEPTHASFITVWPAGAPRPHASNLNVVPGQTVPNLVVAKVGDGGRVSIYNNTGSVHVVVDVQGWFAPDAGFTSVVPSRLLDTREPDPATGEPAPVGSQQSIDLGVVGVGGVPTTGVGAVVLNVTATEPGHSTYLTVWPAGEQRPTASNLNAVPEQTVPNLVIAKVGADGRVSIYNNSGFTHVVVDVAGWFADLADYTPLVPARLLDTRTDETPIAGAATIDLTVTGVGGVPSSGVSSVVLNVTATEPSDDSYLTVWPTGQDRPYASNLNVVAEQTVPNLVIAKVGVDGKISIYNNNGRTHVVVDVQGWFGDAPNDANGAVTEGVHVGWRFVPEQILVEPGSTRIVQLVQTGLDGLPTGSALPAGVTFAMTGQAGSVTATTIGGGLVEIHAGSTIDTAIVAAHIPNVVGATTLAVTVARLKPGVVQIDDAAVAFPQPNLPNDGDLGKIVGPETTSSGVGPFTWAQIEARLDVPTAGLSSASPVGSITARYPVVLRGDAPPNGTLIVGTGGSALLGRIVDSPAGPTLTSNGFSLVTVELVGVQEVYRDLKYSLTYDDLIRIGASPSSVGTSHAAGAPTAQADATDGPSRTNHSAPAGTQPPPPAPDPSVPVNATVSDPGSVVNGGKVDTQKACEVTGNFGLVEVSPAVSLDIVPVLNLQVNIVDDALIAMQVEVGGTLTLTVNAKAKFQLNGSAGISCKIAKLADLEIAAPGPLSGFLSVTGEAEQKFRLNATANGGPKLELGFSCSASASLIGGFTYETASGVTNLSRGTMTPDCQLAGGPAVNAGDDGFGYSVEPTAGLPLVAPMGMRAGGVVVGAIGRFLSWFSARAANIGKFKALEAEVAPQLRLTTENAINAATFKNAKSALAAELVGKISLSIEPMDWLLQRFGLGGGSFGVDLYSQTLPIASGYAALNSTRIEATVAGEDASTDPAVFVQDGDAFTVTSTLAPASSGVGIVVFPIETATLYEAQSDTFLAKSDLFQISVIASTGAEAAYGNTTLKVVGKITPQLCDQLRAAPREFVMMGDAPLDLIFTKIAAPAYGGRFKVQCVEGKIAWGDTELTVKSSGTTTTSITSSGPKDDLVTITGAPLWLSVDPTEIELVGDPGPGESESTDTVSLSERFGLPFCHEPRTATLIANTKHRGASSLAVTEEDPCYMKWDPVSVTGPGQVTANLVTKSTSSSIATLNTISLPDWLTVSPTSLDLPATDGNEQTIPFTFTITPRERKCAIQLPRSFELKVTTDNRGTASILIIDPKIDPYTDCGISFTPARLEDTGTSVLKLRDDQLGDGAAEWEIDDASSLPEWLGVSPLSGTLAADAPATVSFAILGSNYDPCVGRPKATHVVSATATIPPSGIFIVPTRRTATISVSRPAIPPAPCPRTHGGARGDPHMVSMDGVAFEGQILGDYIYSRAPVDAADPFEIVVRTTPTNGSTAPVAPTSVTGTAVTYGESTVEIYPKPGDHDLIVDGIVTVIDDATPLEVSPTITVTRSGATVRVDLPGITVSLSSAGIYDDLDIAAGIGTEMEGLLGSPDARRDNDFASSSGAPYTVADIVENKIPEFFDFVSSWRITDPADSPLSRPTPLFAAPNPGFDQAILDEYGPQVLAALGGSDRICVGGPTGRQLYGLALELSIGTPATDLDRFICSYSVSGFATTDGLPTPGLPVTVDAVGLRPCTTTSGSDGRYLCVMLPELAEVNAVPADDPVVPIDVQVTGRWEGRDAVAASGTAVFDTRSAFNSGPLSRTVDLAVDPNSVPRLDVSGAVTRDGAPLAGERSFQIDAFDAGGTLVHRASTVAVVDNTTGAYAFSRVLPNSAVRAVITTIVDQPVRETFTSEVGQLVGGGRAVAFDVVYTVPTLTVSGTITDGHQPIAGPITGVVASAASDGVPLPPQSFVVTPDPVTGAYTVSIALPRRAAVATATVTLDPYSETYSSTPVPMSQSATSVVLDVVHAPPIANVSGVVVDEHGAGLGQSSQLTATFRNAGGAIVGVRGALVGSGAGGAYAVSLPAPKTATSAVIRIVAGAPGEFFELPSAPIVSGANALTLDARLAPVRLVLSGTMLDEAGNPLGVVPVTVTFRDVNGQYLGSSAQNVTPGAGGAYEATFAGHRNARSAEVSAAAGVNGETFTAVMSALLTGDNPRTFDVDTAPVRLTVSGHITDASGAALPGNVRIDAYFLAGGGQVLSTQTAFSVSPDLANGGAYATSFSGHRESVSVLLRAYVGEIGEFVEATVTGIAHGANSYTFEIVYGAPTVTISGRMTNGASGRLTTAPVPIRIIGENSAGSTIVNQLRSVTLDEDGDYAVTVTMSQFVTAVRATVQIGVGSSDWFQLASTPVAAGTNQIPFDVHYDPPTVTVTGTMTSTPGVALGAPYAPVPVGVTAYGSGGEYLSYTQPSVTPGSGGAYSFDVTLPRATASIEVRAFITGENIAQTFGGFGPGVHQTATLDVVHNPPRVVVQGTAKLAGTVETRPQSVIIVISGYTGSNPVPTYQATTWASPNASGVYSSTFTLKHGSTRAEVQVRPRYGSGAYTGTATDLQPGELRTVGIDFDEEPTTVQLSGEFLLFGAPAESAYLYATAYDAGGHPTSVSVGNAAVDPVDGAFATDFAVPFGSTRVTVFASLTSPDWDESWTTGYDITSLTPNVANPVEWSTDATLLRITGSLVRGGERVVLPDDDPDDGDPPLSFGVTTAGSSVVYGYDTEYEYDNSFSLDVVLAADTTGVTVRLSGVGEVEPVVTYSIPGPSIVDHQWDIDLNDYAESLFVVYGNVTENAMPIVGRNATVDVVGFAYVDRDTPYVETFRVSVPIVTLEDGYYGLGFDLPPNVTLVRTTVTIDGADLAGSDWNQAMEVTPGVDAQLDFDIDIGLSTLRYGGDIVLENCTGPLVFEREFWAFTGADRPTTEYNHQTRTWEGGTRVGSYLVVPDTTAPYPHAVRAHLPAGTTWVGTVYSDHNSGGTGMLSVNADSAIGVGAQETHHC